MAEKPSPLEVGPKFGTLAGPASRRDLIAAYAIYMKRCTTVPDFVFGVHKPLCTFGVCFDVNASLGG
ncbi:hypothetical protein T265_05948 [Opisthorchis viverrini]|uniref:Uncharacterized protein n=1 Tax=Opisthorchis viverrini TaxID=6198 RepID=A0A074ZIR3_OPIVI|nr:hypothetical protein T265_05948 [Opisthorchis viverrini]KER26891.1 hypothetical protein T265_05948 [Opisthorchis viverrini]